MGILELLLLLLLGLGGLSLLGRLAWWVFFQLVGPLLESTRESISSDRVVWLLREQESQRRQLQAAREAAERRQREARPFVTPAGEKLMLDRDGQQQLDWQCCRELGLQRAASWDEIKRAWRRQVKNTHPDMGGDPDIWLRKLRAYEALEKLR